jgi:hypothetical protein
MTPLPTATPEPHHPVFLRQAPRPVPFPLDPEALDASRLRELPQHGRNAAGHGGEFRSAAVQSARLEQGHRDLGRAQRPVRSPQDGKDRRHDGLTGHEPREDRHRRPPGSGAAAAARSAMAATLSLTAASSGPPVGTSAAS